MDTDNLLNGALATARELPWSEILLIAIPVVLLLTILYAVTSKQPDRRVSRIATLVGLAWMAQGMWDAATTTYEVPEMLAGIVFVLFESFMLSGMLHANRYRTDLLRRASSVRFVWGLAFIGGAVVALAEGWQQAPLRFAVPLLVAWNWYRDLTADDDPAERQVTSWRWTPRRALLFIGALEPGAKDAQTIDRDRLRTRMTRLAFAIEMGDAKVSDLLRRKTRLAKLKTVADDADLAEVRARLARMRVSLIDKPADRPEPVEQPVPEVHPVMPPQPAPPEKVQPAKPAEPDRPRQGVHYRDGRMLRGAELKADAVLLMRRSIATGRPMTNADLAASYSPPLKQRSTEAFAAEGRRPVEPRINGHDLSDSSV